MKYYNFNFFKDFFRNLIWHGHPEWSQLEIRPSDFRRSTIPQKHFITIIAIIEILKFALRIDAYWNSIWKSCSKTSIKTISFIQSFSCCASHWANWNLTPTKRYSTLHWYLLKSLCYTMPVGIYMFKVHNRNTRTRCEICLKLTIKTPELLTLNIFHTLF